MRPLADMALPDSACFVASKHGKILGRKLALEAANGRAVAGAAQPYWRRDLHQLYVGPRIVKVFRRPAPIQEMVLDAFEEEGWPERIDDPLPRGSSADAKMRLHDTINRLNRAQAHQGIIFYGDGTGQGVRWRLKSSRQTR